MSTIDDLKKTLDEGFNIAREGVAYAAERAEDLSQVAALRVKIFSLRRRIERLHTELGEAAYRLAAAKGDVWADATVKKAVKEIAELESKVDELFARLDSFSMRASRGAKQARPQPKTAARPGTARRRKKS